MTEEINGIIADLSFADEVSHEQSLKNDLGFDSFSMVNLLVALEDNFNVQFDESDIDFENLETVGDAHRLVERYV